MWVPDFPIRESNVFLRKHNVRADDNVMTAKTKKQKRQKARRGSRGIGRLIEFPILGLPHPSRAFRGRVGLYERIVEIESQWTAGRRGQMGVALLARAHPPAKSAGRVGQPHFENL